MLTKNISSFKSLMVYTINTMCLLFIVFIFLSTIKASVIKIPFKTRVIITSLFPEGWGFFTKNPREEQFIFYRIEKNSIIQVSLKNGSFENFVGFSKYSRRINLETVRLSQMLDDKKKEGNYYVIERKEKFFIYLKSGTYLLKKEKITPWTFINSKYKAPTEYKLIKLID